ncbi:MAG: DMT family transporter [Ignavibacteria bacterium]
MEWLFLILAGLLEIGWAIGLKYTNGFTVFLPSVITVVLMILSFIFLSIAVREIPLGTAYAIWTGIGTLGTVIFGIILFDEATDVVRLFFIAIILIGIIGLKIITLKS